MARSRVASKNAPVSMRDRLSSSSSFSVGFGGGPGGARPEVGLAIYTDDDMAAIEAAMAEDRAEMAAVAAAAKQQQAEVQTRMQAEVQSAIQSESKAETKEQAAPQSSASGGLNGDAAADSAKIAEAVPNAPVPVAAEIAATASPSTSTTPLSLPAFHFDFRVELGDLDACDVRRLWQCVRAHDPTVTADSESESAAYFDAGAAVAVDIGRFEATDNDGDASGGGGRHLSVATCESAGFDADELALLQLRRFGGLPPTASASQPLQSRHSVLSRKWFAFSYRRGGALLGALCVDGVDAGPIARLVHSPHANSNLNSSASASSVAFRFEATEHCAADVSPAMLRAVSDAFAFMQ
jgi:hypothetical protein